MDARTDFFETGLELPDVHHVITRSPAVSFYDLNRRRHLAGQPPVVPASTLTLAHEARAAYAAAIREWRRNYSLRVVGGRR